MSRLFLLACGLLYLGFGLWVLLAPEAGLAYMNANFDHVNALSDLSGSHGGLNVAIGLFLLAAASSPVWHRQGLWLVFLMNAGYLGGRLVALALHGMPTGIVPAVMGLELVLVILALVLAQRSA